MALVAWVSVAGACALPSTGDFVGGKPSDSASDGGLEGGPEVTVRFDNLVITAP